MYFSISTHQVKPVTNATRIVSGFTDTSPGVPMEPRLLRYFWRSLLLALASATATYLFVWGLVTTHPELEIPNGAAMTSAIYMFPIAFLASVVVAASKHAGQRRH
jgi:hypothetical protein